MENTIAVIDLGGQYAHMIGRRLRDIGVGYELIHDPFKLEKDNPYEGYILSGGPQSVYDEAAPGIPQWIATSEKPVLGICYGHQLLAKLSGIEVEPGEAEFGPAELKVTGGSRLLDGFPKLSRVWMSHKDSVADMSNGFLSFASTERCGVASFANDEKRKYGVQFHPEVDHSEHGQKLLENFVLNICGVKNRITVQDQIELQIKKIWEQADGRKIFFFVSGGVDSMVAFALCAKAVGSENVKAVYVDTGFMRKDETQEIIKLFSNLGLSDRLTVLNEKDHFFSALDGVIEPEEKRAVIGKAFIDIQVEQLSILEENQWILGQGTIYPDTIESGGDNENTAKIKTHHNRCKEVIKMISEDRVIEPIRDFYKDEVRKIGLALGIGERIVGRWPFPGPGLAIRCLCSDADVSLSNQPIPIATDTDRVWAIRMPVRSVGVQGDFRTYRDAVAVYGKMSYDELERTAVDICNSRNDFNRVVYHLAGTIPTKGLKTRRCGLETSRINLLRQADNITKKIMLRENAYEQVWQFPVVMIPLSSTGNDDSIILRPVNSKDGMTANFARLNRKLLQKIASAIFELNGVDAVYLDVSDKPPATIEWE